MGRWLILVGLVGCYAPTPPTGAPCDERLPCPSGQACLAGHCEREGTLPGDAAFDADLADAPSDAPTMGWSAPTPVGISLGQTKSDASFTASKLVIAFTRNDDVFFATRASIGGAFIVTAFPHNAVNISDKSPEISADGDTLYYASNPDGDYDIFVSTRVNNGWSVPVKVPAWSAPQNEPDVAISPDELTAFVTIGGDIRRSTRTSKTDPWPAPVAVNVAWGAGPTAPSINSAGDVYYHAGDPRDLFVVRRQGAGYGTPLPLADVNTAAGREAAPFISADDRHLMFERDGELVESTR